MLELHYRRYGTKGDNETLEITVASDREDDATIAIRGTLEIECLAIALRELARKLN